MQLINSTYSSANQRLMTPTFTELPNQALWQVFSSLDQVSLKAMSCVSKYLSHTSTPEGPLRQMPCLPKLLFQIKDKVSLKILFCISKHFNQFSISDEFIQLLSDLRGVLNNLQQRTDLSQATQLKEFHKLIAAHLQTIICRNDPDYISTTGRYIKFIYYYFGHTVLNKILKYCIRCFYKKMEEPFLKNPSDLEVLEEKEKIILPLMIKHISDHKAKIKSLVLYCNLLFKRKDINTGRLFLPILYEQTFKVLKNPQLTSKSRNQIVQNVLASSHLFFCLIGEKNHFLENEIRNCGLQNEKLIRQMIDNHQQDVAMKIHVHLPLDILISNALKMREFEKARELANEVLDITYKQKLLAKINLNEQLSKIIDRNTSNWTE